MATTTPLPIITTSGALPSRPLTQPSTITPSTDLTTKFLWFATAARASGDLYFSTADSGSSTPPSPIGTAGSGAAAAAAVGSVIANAGNNASTSSTPSAAPTAGIAAPLSTSASMAAGTTRSNNAGIRGLSLDECMELCLALLQCEVVAFWSSWVDGGLSACFARDSTQVPLLLGPTSNGPIVGADSQGGFFGRKIG